MKTNYLLSLLLLVFVGCAPGTRFTLHEDNDYFKPTKNNDRNYSQGARFDLEVPDEQGSTTYFFGNNFYTPGFKQLTTPQPNDRPYAGYTYIGADFKYSKVEKELDVFGITVGIIGPHSYSEQFQNQVHRWLDQNTAKGWDNQLDDEIGIILKAERNYWYPINKTFDIVNTLGGHLGNVFTQGYVGANLRYGKLSDPFVSPGIIFPRVPREINSNNWSYYLYGGPFARAVAQNIFLDGNTFKDSQSVEKYPLVAEGRLGVAVEYGLYRFAYTYILQTKEFHNEVMWGDFGEVTLSIPIGF